MAQIFYNTGDLILSRSTAVPGQVSLLLNTSPAGSVFYFDSSGNLQGLTASFMPVTASWAQTASVFLSSASIAGTATSASYSQTASFALNGAGTGTTLTTGSTYSVTASWSQFSATSSLSLTSSLSSSYSLYADNAGIAIFSDFAQVATSASYALNGGIGGSTLVTGSIYSITSSWAGNVNSSSYAPVQPTYSSSVSTQLGTKQSTISTGSTIPITSSWATNSGTATTSNFATFATTATNSNTASFVPIGTYAMTSSWATNALNYGISNIDGGKPDSVYGAITGLNGGNP